LDNPASGAKARVGFAGCMYGLKPVPFSPYSSACTFQADPLSNYRGYLGPHGPLGLLDNHAAGDAITRVAGRIVGEVVRFGVNDERRTAIVEKRIRAFAYGGAHGGEREFAGSLV